MSRMTTHAVFKELLERGFTVTFFKAESGECCFSVKWCNSKKLDKTYDYDMAFYHAVWAFYKDWKKDWEEYWK